MNTKSNEEIVEQFKEKMEMYDMGIGSEVGLFDYFQDILTLKDTQKEEAVREAYEAGKLAGVQEMLHGEVSKNGEWHEPTPLPESDKAS